MLAGPLVMVLVLFINPVAIGLLMGFPIRLASAESEGGGSGQTLEGEGKKPQESIVQLSSLRR